MDFEKLVIDAEISVLLRYQDVDSSKKIGYFCMKNSNYNLFNHLSVMAKHSSIPFHEGATLYGIITFDSQCLDFLLKRDEMRTVWSIIYSIQSLQNETNIIDSIIYVIDRVSHAFGEYILTSILKNCYQINIEPILDATGLIFKKSVILGCHHPNIINHCPGTFECIIKQMRSYKMETHLRDIADWCSKANLYDRLELL